MPNPMTFSVTVDYQGSKALTEGAKLFPEILEAHLYQAGTHVLARVKKLTPKDMGALSASETLRVHVGVGEAFAEVSTSMLYAQTVEVGRAPGRTPPPSSMLVPWLKRKDRKNPPAPRSYLTKTGRRSYRKPPSIESRAFLIARAIGKHGTKGVHMFERGMQESEGTIKRIMEQAVRLIVRACGGS